MAHKKLFLKQVHLDICISSSILSFMVFECSLYYIFVYTQYICGLKCAYIHLLFMDILR